MSRVKRVSAMRRARRPATVVAQRNSGLAPARFVDSRPAADPFFDGLSLVTPTACQALEPRRLADHGGSSQSHVGIARGAA
jgi:hypothetical protein